MGLSAKVSKDQCRTTTGPNVSDRRTAAHAKISYEVLQPELLIRYQLLHVAAQHCGFA